MIEGRAYQMVYHLKSIPAVQNFGPINFMKEVEA
jgi:hypothetical protein